jgi:hypothetical protein
MEFSGYVWYHISRVANGDAEMDLGARLQSHALVNVTMITNEYNFQRDKWKMHLNLVADMQDSAMKHMQDTLEEIKRKQEEANQIMLMAISLIGIVGANWLGAIVELKLFPRFAGKLHFQEFQTFGGWRIKSTRHYSEVAAKIFGDTIKDVTGSALDKVFDSLWPTHEPHQVDMALGAVVESGQIGTFKTLLDNALLSASANVTTQLATLYGNISKTQPFGGDFGDLVVKVVDVIYPRQKNLSPKLNDENQERNGKRMLDEFFDALRKNYAQNWFYFGQNPKGYMHALKFQIELETWALWLLNQKWKLKALEMIDPDTMYDPNPLWYWKSEDGFELEEIMRALEKLAKNELIEDQKVQPPKVPIARTSLKNQPGWVEPIGSNKTGWVQPIDEELDEDKAIATSALTAAKLAYAEKLTDADEEMKRILAWAKSIPGRRLHGGLDSRPRNIGTLSDPPSIFAD